MAQILDGKKCATALKEQVREAIELRNAEGKSIPGLSVILVGDNPASEVYVGHKQRACKEVGMQSTLHKLDESCTQSDLEKLIDQLNNDDDVHGILLQLPLPKHLHSDSLLERINPDKDVDGFHPINLGRLLQRQPGLRPCTPYGIIQLLDFYNAPFRETNAVVVGASNIVGRPMALELLLARCTVTICHRFTKDLAEQVSRADLLVSAVGKPGLIKSEWIKPGAIIVDVGITRLDDGSLVGDIEFDGTKDKASWITPVPGGVGPMTVATLLLNTLAATE